jgi:hypothetical protein
MTADVDVSNALNGNSGPGTPALPYALVARFYDANLFGRDKDYAYPEGSNVSSSRLDSITSMDKLTTRTHKHADGNDYDLWDCAQTFVKWVLTQNIHINDDEKNSVNYKAPATEEK